MNSSDNWISLVSDSLGISEIEIVNIEHAGRGKVARVGEDAVVKLYPTASRKLASAIEANGLLHDLGIAPRILKQESIDSENTALLFERVEGSALSYSSLYDQSCRANLVSSMSRLHSVRGNGFSRRLSDSDAAIANWDTFLNIHFESCEDRFLSRTGRSAPRWFMHGMERALSLAKAASDLLSEIKPSFVHRDITCENVIVTAEGHCFLIDFDLAAFYDPLIDLVKLQLFAPPKAQECANNLIHEYRQQQGMDTEIFETRLKLVRALELLWGYPALVQMASPAAPKWKEEIYASI